MRAYLGLAAAVVLGFAGLAQAGPLDLKQVSADAKWAAHVDVDALMASSVAQKAREQILKEHPEIEAHLSMLRSLWQFDPRTDLHGVTIYGTQLKKHNGVAIIHAKVDQKAMLAVAKNAPGHEVSTYGKYELHAWLKGGKKRENGAFYRPDVIVVGASADELKAALDVLDGTKPNFAAKGDGLAGAIPPGTILFAGAKGLGDAELPCKSPLAKQADSFLLTVGESQGQVSLHAVLTVKDAETAKRIKAAADGALALATLVKSDDADALKVIGGVKVTLADKTVSVEAQTPADLLWAQMQKEIAKKKAERERRRHAKSGD